MEFFMELMGAGATVREPTMSLHHVGLISIFMFACTPINCRTSDN